MRAKYIILFLLASANLVQAMEKKASHNQFMQQQAKQELAEAARLPQAVVVGAAVADGSGEQKVVQSAAVAAQMFMPVRVPVQLGVQDKLKLDDIEFFSKASFAELLKKQHAAGDACIIVRTITQNDEQEFVVHYYDAHGFNKKFFCDDQKYPMVTSVRMRGLFDRATGRHLLKDPESDLSLLGHGIHYFICEGGGQKEFAYLCSHADMYLGTNQHCQIFWSRIMRTNQSEDKQLKIKAQFLLGEAYYNGWGIVQNRVKAFKCLLYVSNDLDGLDPNDKAMVQFSLGFEYFQGLGTVQDHAKGFKYLLDVSNHLDKLWPRAKATAQFLLAQAYYNGWGIVQDHAKVFKYLLDLSNDLDGLEPVNRVLVQFTLGQAYYLGRGTEIDEKKTYMWFREVAQQNVHVEYKNLAIKQLEFWQLEETEKNKKSCCWVM